MHEARDAQLSACPYDIERAADVDIEAPSAVLGFDESAQIDDRGGVKYGVAAAHVRFEGVHHAGAIVAHRVSENTSVQTYLPVNFGLRFSLNARTPSCRSSVGTARL